MSRGIDSRQPAPEHQNKRRYPLTHKRYRQPYFPFIPINSRFSLKLKPSVNLQPFPSTPKDFRLYRIPIAGDCQERKSLLRTRGRLFAIGENRKPGKTRAAEKRRRFSVFVLAAVFLPVTLPPAARGAKGRPARSPGGRDNRRGHAGSCHCGRRPASPQRRPRRRDHG